MRIGGFLSMRNSTNRLRVSIGGLALALVAGLSLGPPGTQQAEAQPDLPWMDPELPAEERADLLIDAMTLDQKIQ